MKRKNTYLGIFVLLTSLLLIQLFSISDLSAISSGKMVGYSILLENQQNPASQINNDPFNEGFAIGGAFALSIFLFFFYIAHSKRTILLLSGYFFIRAILLAMLLKPVLESEVFLLVFTKLNLLFLLIASDIILFWFSQVLFDIKKHLPKISKALKYLIFSFLLYLPISMFLEIKMSFYLGILIHLLANIFLFTLSISLLKRSQRLAILFTAFIFIEIIFSLVNPIALIGFNIDVYGELPYLYSISFWLSGLLTIFILSRNNHYQTQDKQRAQQQVLEIAMTSKKAQEELLALQEEDQELLESRVQERTLELNIALQELEYANKELAEKNTLDELTGLFNRRHYDQKIIAEHRRSRRNLTPLSLVMIDIDHFKNVNDTYGHLAGDQCLVWLAAKIKTCLGRGTDIGCRYGGEEFCLILPETDTQGAIALAEELRLAVCAQSVTCQNVDIELTISCGVSTYQQEAEALPEQLFSAADKALYMAKNNGRNQVQQQKLIETLPSYGVINE